MGIHNELIIQEKHKLARIFFLIGIIFIVGFYNLGLFSQRKEDKSSLILAFFCFFIIIHTSSVGKLYHQFFPMLEYTRFEMLRKIEYISFLLLCPLIYNFLHKISNIK